MLIAFKGERPLAPPLFKEGHRVVFGYISMSSVPQGGKPMLKALLFDLDGTLLDSDMEVFLPRYLEALTPRVAHLIPPEKFVAQLLRSTAVMARNTDPSKTNQQAFAEDFFPKIGCPPEVLRPIFDDFYAHDFGRLRAYTRAKPEARPIMEKVFAQGYEVVIATNPVFPRTAILQRLEWAGVADFDYKLITSYENMHFCKPRPEYYEEILAKIGRRAEECLMVGDEAMDMAAARVGIRTFLITESDPGDLRPDFHGTLADFERFVDEGRLRQI